MTFTRYAAKISIWDDSYDSWVEETLERNANGDFFTSIEELKAHVDELCGFNDIRWAEFKKVVVVEETSDVETIIYM